jgi:hypothetical protein
MPVREFARDRKARWGDLLDAEKMKKCVWMRPKLVAVFEFLEWTEGRDDKNPRGVVKEQSGEG